MADVFEDQISKLLCSFAKNESFKALKYKQSLRAQCCLSIFSAKSVDCGHPSASHSRTRLGGF
jgi:hypothetical protein